jgi:hypothetical protein
MYEDYRPTILRAISEALAVHFSNESEASFQLYQSTYPVIAPPSDGTVPNTHAHARTHARTHANVVMAIR